MIRPSTNQRVSSANAANRGSRASSARRTWYGYSAYNPEAVLKLLAIFRVFYNYCLARNDRTTPAMRLGLAHGKVTPEDIIYF